MAEIVKKPVQITETILRDAHQSLIATRMRTDEMLPIVPKLDEVGYRSVECWGGATFDAALRFLKEDPWDRLRKFRDGFKKTKLQMLFRGQNILGYRPYADDVVEYFVQKSVANGIDIIRIFDCLNDLRNLETAVKAANKEKAEAQVALSYTLGEAYTLEYWVEKAKAIEEMGADSICIKDMAGLLVPKAATELIGAMKEVTKLPIQLHTHYTSGEASMTYMKAVEAGVDVIDCAISPFALGTSQPATEVMVEAFRGTEYDTGYDLNLLNEIAEYFRPIREKYIANGLMNPKNMGVDIKTLLYQVPGGMLSNLTSQLDGLGAADKFYEVLAEVPNVRKDMGEPPLVTPSSQIVGSQAVMNVVMGERYKVVTKESKDLFLGKYGKSTLPFNEEIQKKCIGDEEPITCRPADLIPNELETLEKEMAEYKQQDEDVLTYALFPQVAIDFFKYRNGEGEGPEVIEAPAKAAPAPAEAQKTAFEGTKYYAINVNGVEYNVTVEAAAEGAAPVAAPAAVPAPAAPAPAAAPAGGAGSVEVTASLPGKVFKVEAAAGQAVKAGDAIVILEAMKMEVPVVAPQDGTIASINVSVGDAVEAGTLLATMN